MSNSETVHWTDGSTSDDTVLEAKLNKGVTEVLGYKCDELILTCKNSVEKYYFNSAIAVDPSLFSRHRYGNWAYLTEKIHALPLKMVITMAPDIEETAVAIDPQALDVGFFQLPAGANTAENPH